MPLLLIAVYQGWALWQILRGRVRGPVRAGGGAVRALRVTLYLCAAYTMLELFPVILPWWAKPAGAAAQLALVVLFFLVLRGVSRAVTTVALVAGTLAVVSRLARTAADTLDARGLGEISAVAGLGGLSWTLWVALTLLAQARDGRWARATVWTGVAALVVTFLIGSLASRRLAPFFCCGRPVGWGAPGSGEPEPTWTDHGDLMAYEPDGDPGGDLPYPDDVLSAGPGHLIVHTRPDVTLRVTTETYRRRPPVETKGWDHVVEVGYRSSGRLVFLDPLRGATLPDLAVRGAGHYRVRVHYAMRGDVQRLLIMAYPGRGDDVVVHRKRATR